MSVEYDRFLLQNYNNGKTQEQYKNILGFAIFIFFKSETIVIDTH